MSSESFDIKFSSVACVLFELRHLPKFFGIGFLCRFAPCKWYKKVTPEDGTDAKQYGVITS